MTEAPLLTVENVHAYYGSSHVLQGVSIGLQAGVIGLVGRNGMGKTTLVKTIMGIIPAREGRIHFRDKEITSLKPYEIGALGIGYVPQGRGLFPSLSVREHLVLAARPGNGAGWGVAGVFDLFPALKERQKLGAASLSGGEQQMLAIGRALVINPSLLIMDEPSEGLAPVILDHLIETYRSLINSGISIILVEQNLRTATALADELYIMIAGCIVDKVSGKLLLHDQHAREQFLGVKVRAA